MTNLNHEYWMKHAINLAKYAWEKGEVPIGAILVANNKIISKGWNMSISQHDPTAHAEIVALRQGGTILQNYRLLKCILYVTLEPCIMCTGAIIHGRINTLVYGARDTKKSPIISLRERVEYLELKHKIQVVGGILAPICSEIINNFFRMRRLQKKQRKSIIN